MSMQSSYYHTNDWTTIDWLIAVLQRASEQGQSVRFNVENQTLQVKRGEGAWSAPLRGTPDLYRDGLDHATKRLVDAS